RVCWHGALGHASLPWKKAARLFGFDGSTSIMPSLARLVPLIAVVLRLTPTAPAVGATSISIGAARAAATRKVRMDLTRSWFVLISLSPWDRPRTVEALPRPRTFPACK